MGFFAHMADRQTERPTQVTRAVWLLWIALALSVVSSVPTYFEPLPPESSVPNWSLWVVLALVFVFWGLLTLLIGRRHNWARITTLLLFVAGLGFWFWDPSMFSDLPTYSLALEFIETVVTAIALYWLFTGSGASWFRTAKGPDHAL